MHTFLVTSVATFFVQESQCSNWEDRPLTIAQLEYAAGDVVCPLEIFEVLCKKAERLRSRVVLEGFEDFEDFEGGVASPPPFSIRLF